MIWLNVSTVEIHSGGFLTNKTPLSDHGGFSFPSTYFFDILPQSPRYPAKRPEPIANLIEKPNNKKLQFWAISLYLCFSAINNNGISQLIKP